MARRGTATSDDRVAGGRGYRGGVAAPERKRPEEGCPDADDLGKHNGEDELDCGRTLNEQCGQREPAVAPRARQPAECFPVF